MARDEESREDLMREAVALVRRIELRVAEEPAPVIVGFRRDGAASFFFGEDPVVQFNARGELRRAYVQGRLIKVDRGRLVALTRVRTEHETQLVRHDLGPAETERLVEETQQRLAGLREMMETGRCRVLRQAPEDEDLFAAVRAWLSRSVAPLRIAASPRL